MKKAYHKDITRTIYKGKRRFLSIALITALGITMLTGLRAACTDLKYSADRFFDGQMLFDLSIVSTLGLTEDDVQALIRLDEIETAEGAYSETVHVSAMENRQTAEVKTLSKTGINSPYLLEGTLPQNMDEIAVTENYLKDTGKSIGDTLELETDGTKEEDSALTGDVFTITASVVDPTDINTADGAVSFRSTKSTDYTFFITPEAADNSIYTAVYLTLSGGADLLCYSEDYENLVKKASAAVETDVKAGREQARYDEVTEDAKKELADAEQTMKEEFAGADEQFADSKKELEDGLKELENVQKELNEQLTAAKEEFEKAGLQPASAELSSGQTDAEAKLEEAQRELDENRKKLADGEREWEENKQEYDKKRLDAEQKLEDARKEIESVAMTQWYIQDRSSLSGYVNIRSDASSIEAVGTAFPIIFFIVAILISLTTITRMVEEDRGLLGTYKALGFTDGEIRRKYLLYALAACLLGGLLGDLCGFILLPEIVFSIFGIMYQLPSYLLQFDFLYGIGGALLFVLGITGAAMLACQAELRQDPAVLMRPKAPHSGVRVLLEYITPLWRRLSFLNKVTARNLFRYKKRLFMTAAGIMGCSALVLCGFAIKDSVTDLMPRQYEQIYQYDLITIASTEESETLLSYLDHDEMVSGYLNVQIDSVKVKNRQGGEEKVQLIAVPDGSSLEGYICLEDPDGKQVLLDDSGIFITQNASQVLNFNEGDTVYIQNLKLEQKEAKVSRLVQNYLGNTVYMTQTVYEDLFGKYEPNGVLAVLSDSCADQPAFADALGRRDGILSSVSTRALKEEFSTAFSMINMVVSIIIIMAAGLALVVLFTLSTTNISERVRELATIKVLGFYDREVHLYVNKETLILTAIGIVLGLPLGRALGGCLTYVLKMPSIHFAVSIHPISYLYAAAISLGFALLVDQITNRVLNRIDPVEALKSVE